MIQSYPARETSNRKHSIISKDREKRRAIRKADRRVSLLRKARLVK